MASTRCLSRHHLILLLSELGIAILGLLLPVSHARVCPPCGSTAVPYPLSTAAGCGDPAYKVRCGANSSALFFDALNGTSYPITSISAASQRLVLSPAPFVSPGSCVSEGAPAARGVQLNASLPFNVSSSNTIMLLNCTQALLQSPLNCSSNSLCHVYANATGSTASACAPLPLCCTFVAGGSSTSYNIRVSPQFCSAYRSFVGLDPAQPPATWGRRLGLELQWATPREPLCRTQADCEDGANATCADDPIAPSGAGTVRRCFCVSGLTWSPLAGACQQNPSDCQSHWRLWGIQPRSSHCGAGLWPWRRASACRRGAVRLPAAAADPARPREVGQGARGDPERQQHERAHRQELLRARAEARHGQLLPRQPPRRRRLRGGVQRRARRRHRGRRQVRQARQHQVHGPGPERGARSVAGQPPQPRAPARLLRRPGAAAHGVRVHPQRHARRPPLRRRRQEPAAAAPVAPAPGHRAPDGGGHRVPALRGRAAHIPPRHQVEQHPPRRAARRQGLGLRAVPASGAGAEPRLHVRAGDAGVPGPGVLPQLPAHGQERRVQLRRRAARAAHIEARHRLQPWRRRRQPRRARAEGRGRGAAHGCRGPGDEGGRDAARARYHEGARVPSARMPRGAPAEQAVHERGGRGDRVHHQRRGRRPIHRAAAQHIIDGRLSNRESSI